MRIYVRETINDSLSDFDYLFDLWSQVHKDQLSVIFDFTYCRFLRQNAVAFLGGLARSIRHNSGSVDFDWNTLRDNVHANLAQNGFLAAFGAGEEPWMGNSILYREDSASSYEDGKQVIAYLKDQWLGRDWIQVSPPLRDEIVSRVIEIYDNAFAHARSPVGVMSCGQHYPRLQRLKLTVVDYGVGIPANVRAFLGRPDMTAAQALHWALQPGTTTKPREISRGLGLDLLKTFVRTNKGQLEIFSGGGYAVISEYVEHSVERSPVFEGTLVNITLRCDEAYYRLASEAVGAPLF